MKTIKKILDSANFALMFVSVAYSFVSYFMTNGKGYLPMNEMTKTVAIVAFIFVMFADLKKRISE